MIFIFFLKQFPSYTLTPDAAGAAAATGAAAGAAAAGSDSQQRTQTKGGSRLPRRRLS